MSKILSLILALVLALGAAVPLISCTSSSPPPPSSEVPPPKEEEPTEDPPSEDDNSKLVVPEYKDYGRGTCNFSLIEYQRPDADALIKRISAVTDAIKANEISFEEQIERIESLEDGFNDFLTMYSYANVMNSKDSSSDIWGEEFSYISKAYPSFSKAVESLFVAAAISPNNTRFENEYFGDGLIEKYRDGGKYTDALVLLMEEESELESRYSSLSTDNIEITYESFENKTFDYIVSFYETNYGKESVSYKTAYEECLALYEKEVSRVSIDILVELFRVRRKISDELGYDSYAKLAYSEIYHDYTEKELLSFVSDIKSYIIPVYLTVENFVFSDFFSDHSPSESISKNKLINDTYSVLLSLDTDIGEIFAYMLQHELFDVGAPTENRFDGSFVTYLDKYEAPYLFVTASGTASDYMSLSHEFGHFIDNYVNYGTSTSLDLSEVSSNAFEWIMLDALGKKLSQNDIKYLTYQKYRSAMEVFIYQGFYALFEHYAYKLELENIDEHTLTLALKKAAEDIGFMPDAIDSLDLVTIPHIMLYPFYVQSYCVSEAIALDIYLMGKDGDVDAIDVYKELIFREEELELCEHLDSAGIECPFKAGYIRRIADEIHYQIIGSHCYTDGSSNNGTHI